MIGIGGSGMYPLAQVLHAKGYSLTGSDNNESDTLAAVREMGIPVQLGQRAENLGDADLVIYSAAIAKSNPERMAAEAAGIPMMERSELLGIVSTWYRDAVCIAGTHGKTTTSAMLAQICRRQALTFPQSLGGSSRHWAEVAEPETVRFLSARPVNMWTHFCGFPRTWR